MVPLVGVIATDDLKHFRAVGEMVPLVGVIATDDL